MLPYREGPWRDRAKGASAVSRPFVAFRKHRVSGLVACTKQRLHVFA